MCLASSIFFFFAMSQFELLAHHSKTKKKKPMEDNICQSTWDKSQVLWREHVGGTHWGSTPVLVHSRQKWSLIFQVHLTWSFTTLSVAVFWAVFLLLQFSSLLNKAFFFFPCFNSNSFAKACTSSKELPMLSLLLWL